MSALPLPVYQGTPEWLEAKLDGIGSSEAPIVAGEKGSTVALWAVKAGHMDAQPPDEATQRIMDWGKRLEPVIADWYTDETGRPLRRVRRLLRHPSVPYALASLDRVSARKGERRIVEIKNTRSTRWERGEPVPGDVQAQVQHQLWVTGYDVADVVVLVAGSDPRIIEVPRDDAFIDDLAWLEAAFWRHVEIDTRPAIDGSEETRRALARMFPADSGLILAPPAELEEIVGQLQAAKGVARAADDHVGTLENVIRALLGEATGAVGTGWKATWKKNADSDRIDWAAVARGYRSLLEKEASPETLDAIQSIHTVTTPGPRVLRVSFTGEPR